MIKLKGYWSAINVRQGDAWKIQMQTFNVNLAPAMSAQTKWMRPLSGNEAIWRTILSFLAIS
jgi:hypothetical protein